MNKGLLARKLREAEAAIRRILKNTPKLVSIRETAFYNDVARALRLVMEALVEVERENQK